MTKTIEYSADRAEEKQDVSKVVEQDGKKWKLKKVDYKIIKKDPVMTKKKVIKTVKSTPVPDGKEYSPKESVEISGVTYQLHEEDLTLIQGIIDVFWIEDDGITVLDYKTDRVDTAQELIDRYATQLKLYADALERVFAARKLKVKEILIYSFSLEQLITL